MIKSVGKIKVAPGRITVGCDCTVVFQYTAGSTPVKKGGGIKIEIPGRQGWSLPKLRVPSGHGPEDVPSHGLVTVDSSNKKTGIECEIGFPNNNPRTFLRPWLSRRVIIVRIKNGELQKGDSLHITYGATRCGDFSPAHTASLTVDNPVVFPVHIDCKGDGNYVSLNPFPEITLFPRKTSFFSVIVPSIVKTGKKFGVKVAARDDFLNPAPGYKGHVKLSFKKKEKGFNHKFSSKDKGTHIYDNVSLKKKGTYVFKAINAKNHLSGESNPVKVSTNPEYLLLWGDLHAHSNLSCDVRVWKTLPTPPSKCYTYARDIACLDFAALTDHHFIVKHKYIPPLFEKDWELLQKTADSFNESGRFITLKGFEVTCLRGDTNIYFMEEQIPLCPQVETIRNVWNFYKDFQILSIPHLHQTGGFIQHRHIWKDYDDGIEPLIEICSNHGRYEYYGNTPLLPEKGMIEGFSTTDFLNRGRKLGFTAGSDDHSGRPGYYVLTAVYTSDFTREALFYALRQRRCYATTGARMFIDFGADGHMMGEEYTSETKPKFKVNVVGTDKIAVVEIIKNGNTLYKRDCTSQSMEFEYTDISFNKKSSYYLRIRQVDDQMGWTSPIWINKRKH